MTDNEIIKAFECCNNGWCDGRCPYYGREDIADCREQSGADQLDLINRQKAEIERLNKQNLSVIKHLKKARRQLKTTKAEAYKEYHIRAKACLKANRDIEQQIGNNYAAKTLKEIENRFDGILDNLVKEMVGDGNV